MGAQEQIGQIRSQEVLCHLARIQEWTKQENDLKQQVNIVCALTTPIDGSGDDKITCFKPDGSIGTKRSQLLKEFRAQQMAGDGSNDSEDAGIEEDEEEPNFEMLADDEQLFPAFISPAPRTEFCRSTSVISTLFFRIFMFCKKLNHGCAQRFGSNWWVSTPATIKKNNLRAA
uniref:Uncharacterized protein n=1 Tax=Ditylenchus dipsaci TaxID=166011 RepID=A0A915ELN9_9BILA